MAQLSERTNKLPINNIKTTGEKIMNVLRTVNVTLIDNNKNLKGSEKIVFQSLNYVTEHNDDRTIQSILMEGDVVNALKKHNAKRNDTTDKDILRNTGRKVNLDEVEIFDLQWKVVEVA